MNSKYTRDSNCLNNFPRLREFVSEDLVQSSVLCESEECSFVYHCNIRSLRKSWTQFLCTVYKCLSTMDVIILTETNIKKIESPFYQLDGYVKYELLKPGGIMIFVKDRYISSHNNCDSLSCDILHVSVETSKNVNLDIYGVYRHPKENRLDFINELANVILTNTNNTVLFCGDININLNDIDTDTVVKRYDSTLCESGFMRCISGNTREEWKEDAITASCIDHIYFRGYCGVNSAVIQSKIADHYAVCVSLDISGQIDNRDINSASTMKYNDTKIMENVNSFTYSNELKEKNVNDLYNHLRTSINLGALSEVTVKPKDRKEVGLKPWMNKNLHQLLKERDRLFKISKNNKSNLKHRDAYKSFRNFVDKQTKLAVKTYYESQLSENGNNVRKTWNLINGALGKNAASVDDTIGRHLGKVFSETDIVENFAKTFVNDVNKVIHECDNRISEYVRCNVASSSFYMPPAKTSDVLSIVNSMCDKLSPGYDNLRPRDLKLFANVHPEVITDLVNKSLSEGVVPDELKISICRPIYKKGSYLDYVNYRPVCEQSMFSKIMETYVAQKVMDYAQKYNFIHKYQYAYQRKKGTEILLEDFSSYINNELNRGRSVLCLFIDFSKAFDTINHKLLLQTLENIGIRGNVLKWFKSYLQNRRMTVRFKNRFSKKYTTSHGVPQGSVLGPLLFILFLNDIFKVCLYCKIYIYADDIVLIVSHYNVRDALDMMQRDFNEILKWTHDNYLIINSSKSKVMLIKRPNTLVQSRISVVSHKYDCLHNNMFHCECPNLEEVFMYPYLGVTVDATFSWTRHIDSLNKKLKNITVALYNLRTKLPSPTLRMVYVALAESIIRYGIGSWGAASDTYINEIKERQIIMLKTIMWYKSRTQFIENAFSDLNVLSVSGLYFQNIVNRYYFSCKYKEPFQQHHSTRHAGSGKFGMPLCNNKYGERTLDYQVPKCFNKLPSELLVVAHVCEAKRKIRKWILENNM